MDNKKVVKKPIKKVVKKPVKKITKKPVKKPVKKPEKKPEIFRDIIQNVNVNTPEAQKKRTYTRRKPTVPKQPNIIYSQPQQFQPNNQLAINDLTDKLKQHEKALQKRIDDDLKKNEKKNEIEIKKELGRTTGSIPLIQEIRSSRLNKDADNDLSRFTQQQPPPQTPINSLSSNIPLAPARLFTTKDTRDLISGNLEKRMKKNIEKDEKDEKKRIDDERKQANKIEKERLALINSILKKQEKKEKTSIKNAFNQWKEQLVKRPRGPTPKGKKWNAVTGEWINIINN
jgi:hypothetical protein